jgi:hydrogenase/urease accessory protein HupE
MEMRHREIAQYLLAVVVVVGFFTVLGLMLHWQRPGSDILVGSLAAAFGALVGYFYGSSAGSQAKTELLAKAHPVRE